ncbi:S26 family signal peptidase [Microbacterium profundi]|uniref:S26 family signal peptidase n=1 Tax=Microbacterium profundi TaxID=450380 RepID=A0ABV3LJH0_9MICO
MTTDAPAASVSRPIWRRLVGSTWFHLIAAFVVVGLLLMFVAKPYLVPSASMESTLQPGDRVLVPSASMESTLQPRDRVLVNRLAYVGSEPATGDIIVFDANESWGERAMAASTAIRGHNAPPAEPRR